MIAGHRVLAPRTGSLSSPRLPPAPGHCPRAGQPRARRRGLLPNSGLAGGAGHGWAAALGFAGSPHRLCQRSDGDVTRKGPELPATAQAGPWPRHVTACLEGHAGPRLRSRGDLALHQEAAAPSWDATGRRSRAGTRCRRLVCQPAVVRPPQVPAGHACGPAVHRVRGDVRAADLRDRYGTGRTGPSAKNRPRAGPISRPQATTCASDDATGSAA